MDGGGRRSPRLTASGEESVERVPKRNNRSVSPPPPAQTGVKARPRREPVRSGKGASQGTVVGPALAKTGRDRAAGVEEELVDLPAWSAEEDEEEEAAGTGPGPEPELPVGGGAVVEAAAVQDLVAGARGAEAKVAAGTEAGGAAGAAGELLRGLEERLSAQLTQQLAAVSQRLAGTVAAREQELERRLETLNFAEAEARATAAEALSRRERELVQREEAAAAEQGARLAASENAVAQRVEAALQGLVGELGGLGGAGGAGASVGDPWGGEPRFVRAPQAPHRTGLEFAQQAHNQRSALSLVPVPAGGVAVDFPVHTPYCETQRPRTEVTGRRVQLPKEGWTLRQVEESFAAAREFKPPGKGHTRGDAHLDKRSQHELRYLSPVKNALAACFSFVAAGGAEEEHHRRAVCWPLIEEGFELLAKRESLLVSLGDAGAGYLSVDRGALMQAQGIRDATAFAEGAYHPALLFV
jgi:hypothetical protein